jgi:hypothetical protein
MIVNELILTIKTYKQEKYIESLQQISIIMAEEIIKIKEEQLNINNQKNANNTNSNSNDIFLLHNERSRIKQEI